MSTFTRSLVLGAVLSAGAGAAAAHTGHGTESFSMGLAHPLGADHLLAMVAVGLWSAVALPARRAWQGPATFLAVMLLAATFAIGGSALPGLEYAIGGSVVALGLLLAATAWRRVPASVGLALVACAAALHGGAHGAEAPLAGAFGAYALGFGLSTAALQAGGLAGGRLLRRAAPVIVATLGLALGGAGVALVAAL